MSGMQEDRPYTSP